MGERTHLLDRLDVIEARGRLAERVGTLKVHELVHQTRRIDTLARKRAHHIEQAGALGAQRLVMVFDQQAHIADQIVRERQAIHDDTRLLGAELGMTVEVAAAVVIDRKALGFGNVVQKRRPHKARRGRDAVAQRQLPCHRQHAGDMLVDVKRMIDAALIKPASGRELGHGGANKLGVAQHRVSPMAGRKNALELNAHALARHSIEQRRALGKRLFSLRLDHKIQTAGKTHRAQHAKRVLVKTTLGISNGADELAV